MVKQQSLNWNTIESQCNTRLGRVQIVRGTWDRPIDAEGTFHVHHLELNLIPIPGGARACFVDRWEPGRLEPFGKMFFFPAQQRVRFKSNCRQQRSIVCDFDPTAVENWFEDSLEFSDCRLEALLNIGNSRISNLLFQIGEEVSNPGFASESMIELMSSQIAIELARHLKNIDDDKVRGGLATWRLELIDQRVADISTQPSLTELADLCGLSVRHMTRGFRNSIGQSIGTYIAQKRAEQARRLIASGLSIKSVAYSMGFSAPSNFTASFVRTTGETPREYRQRVCGTKPGTVGLFETTH